MDINLPLLKQAMVGQVDRNSVVANNLANINTKGFKKDIIFFDKLQNEMEVTIQARQAIDFNQGALIETQNPLDLALSGRGFFTVETENGVGYTREGNFKLDADGILRNSSGYAVLGQGGWISLLGDKLNPKEISITQDGEIFVDEEMVDKLLISDFEAQDKLRKIGANLFMANEDMMPIEARDVEVQQGFLEESNVNAADEMIELIEVERQFESVQRIVRTLDDVFRAAATQVGQYR